MGDEFDYGTKGRDGQWERHPTLEEGALIRTIHREYRHLICDKTTELGGKIADSFAIDPKYYTHTFCCHCKDYFPVAEFEWPDGSRVGQ